MSQRVLRGLAAAGGVAVARALVVRDPEAETEADAAGGEGEQLRASKALALVAEELRRLAEDARSAGRVEEAEILDTNRAMAQDPVLLEEILALSREVPAAAAVRSATERHAELIAGLDDPRLAARASDVRQLGRRAVRLLSGRSAGITTRRPAIVIARDLGPADVAELELAGDRIRGIALAEGSATSHAAIMARSLGLPMAAGLGEEVLDTPDGAEVVLDGENGVAVVFPTRGVRRRALHAAARRRLDRRRLAAGRGLPAITRDGRALRLLCNASSTAEVRAGLAAGAEGVGLLRTELAFLEVDAWPRESEHAATLEPILAPLAGRVATVRTLDFGADKTPPFLSGVADRGLELTLAHPEAFAAQLRAIVRAGAATRLRILLPLVETAEQLVATRLLVLEAWEATGSPGRLPDVGAMIETPGATERVAEIAAEADFLSIGTNDLVQYTLGLDRARPLATAHAAADPAVLALVSRVVEAARAERIAVEVCGEAAGELPLVVLFLGLGIDELSVAPARLDEVRAAIRRLSAESAREAAATALRAPAADRALALAEELLSAEAADELGQARDSVGGVLA